MRSLALGEQPQWMLDNYETFLRGCAFPEGEIQALAAVLMDVILGLMRGTLRGGPQFECRDRERPGFSCYVFADDVVAGFYSSTPDKVFLRRLVFTFELDADVAAVATQMRAEVRAVAA